MEKGKFYLVRKEWPKAFRALTVVGKRQSLVCSMPNVLAKAHRYTSRRVRVPQDVGLYSPVGASGISSVGWPSVSSPLPGEPYVGDPKASYEEEEEAIFLLSKLRLRSPIM